MQLAEMNWPAVSALSKDTPVVFPVAALEQHGRHLPLFTDSMLLSEVARRAAEKLKDRVVFAPVMWLGNSAHHMDFPGTLTAAPRVYLDLLADLLECFIAHGFRRLVILNGHGGNIVPGQQAVFETRQRHRQRNDLLLLFATYWTLGAKPHETDKNLRQQRMMHACEWETSMILRLSPHLVHGHQDATAVEYGRPFEPAARGWITKDRSEPGHVGDPRPATAEKGELLFRLFAEDVVRFLERVVLWDGRSWSETG